MQELNPREWVDRYSDLLFRYALLRINDREQARDLVQETFIAAWKGAPGFKGAASEKTWLLSILRNKIIDYYRKETRSPIDRLIDDTSDERVFFDELGRWTPSSLPTEWSGHDVEKKEFYSVLERCKDKLHRIQSAVFSMKYLDDMDAPEICKELRISSSYYWVLLHRAKLHLRACLEKNWFTS